MSTVIAPAKLTWFLEITGRRSDGFHLLRSEMVSLDLCDSLEIAVAEHTELRVSGSAEGVSGVPRDGTNLVARALAAVNRTARVDIDKAIPSGAGLGGGSSDAAAVLRWADCFDVEVATRLGADVPFCLRGGRALVQGIGEQVTALTFERREITLILAPFSVNTANCYAAFDRLSERAGASGRNHLFEAACAVEPRVRTLQEFVASVTGREVVLAGSGSTMFIEGSVSGLDAVGTLESPVGELQVRRAVTTPALAN